MAAVLALVAGAPLLAQRYRFTDLGTMGTGLRSHALVINNLGQIVGTAETVPGGEFQPCFIDGPGQMVSMGGLPGLPSAGLPHDINDDGLVVGSQGGWPVRAFMIRRGGSMQEVMPGYTVSGANVVNKLGQIAGVATQSGYWTWDLSFFRYPDGSLDIYQGILGERYWCGVLGMNDAGQMVGSSGNRAWIKNPGNPDFLDLGTLPGGSVALANAINNLGQIAGSAQPAGSATDHAMLMDPGGPMRDLGSFSGDSSIGGPRALNDRGQVVGRSRVADGSDHGFIVEPGGAMEDLNTITGGIPMGTVIQAAIAINNAGWIVGYTGDPYPHACLLTPVVNRPPVLDPVGDRSLEEGQPCVFTVTAHDPDGDRLALAASNLPAGATFDAGTGAFAWTPAFDQAGVYPGILFSATDDGHPPMKDSVSITLSVGAVNRPPELAAIGSRSGAEGQRLTFLATGSDPDGDPLVLAAANLPAGASFDTTTWTFDWTPGFDQAGNYPVTFTLSDGGTPPMQVAETVTFTIAGVNRPPVLAPIGNLLVRENETLAFTVVAADPDGDPLLYSAANLPPGAAFDPATQAFAWTPSFAQAGNWPDVEFTVSDNGCPMEVATVVLTITVNNVNRAPVFTPVGTQVAREGEALQFSVQASDPDGDRVTYGVEGLPSGAAFDPGFRLFSWTPGYDQGGPFRVAFVATDDGSPSQSGRLEVAIAVGIPTPCELAGKLTAAVASLRLAKATENAFMANLKKVCGFVEDGRIGPAVNQIDAFLDKLQVGMASGTVPALPGAGLRTLAQGLRSHLQP